MIATSAGRAMNAVSRPLNAGASSNLLSRPLSRPNASQTA